MCKKALVLLSGGQDSTTCFYWALKNFDEVFAIGFDYGQRHILELELARRTAEGAAVDYNVLKIDTLPAYSPNALTNISIEISADSSGNQPPNTLVEGRNLLFLTYAAIYAKLKNITDLVIGVSQTDYSGYPDCRNEFIQSAQQTLQLAFNYPFILHTPLMWKSKMETWQMADELEVLNLVENNTLTCYNGIVGAGCGSCPACILRNDGLAAFKRKNTKAV